jgi:hypothetical protein
VSLAKRLCNPKFWRSKKQIEIPEGLGQGEALYLIHLLLGGDVGQRGVTRVSTAVLDEVVE